MGSCPICGNDNYDSVNGSCSRCYLRKEKRLEEISKITDQAKLAYIAKHEINDYEDTWSAEAAIEKLTDQELLADFVLSTTNEKLRLLAASKLDNFEPVRHVIEDIVKNGKYRSKACRLLTDQTLLADIAENDADEEIRIIAADKLNDKELAQRMFTDIALRGESYIDRVKAADRLENRELAQQVYTDIAKNDGYIDAMDRVTDQRVLAEIAANAANKRDARIWAVAKLSDQAMLTDIVLNVEDRYVRKYAVEKLTDNRMLFQVAENDDDDDVREAAASRLYDVNWVYKNSKIGLIKMRPDGSDRRKWVLMKYGYIKAKNIAVRYKSTIPYRYKSFKIERCGDFTYHDGWIYFSIYEFHKAGSESDKSGGANDTMLCKMHPDGACITLLCDMSCNVQENGVDGDKHCKIRIDEVSDGWVYFSVPKRSRSGGVYKIRTDGTGLQKIE